MAQTSGFNLPPPQEPFVDKVTLNLSFSGYQYLLSLLNAAATSQATATVATGLSATGITQATALQLNAQWNEVDSASILDGNDGVLLSALQPGQSQTVFNESGVSINIYPPPGGTIDANLINQPYALAGGRVTFDFTSETQIRSS